MGLCRVLTEPSLVLVYVFGWGFSHLGFRVSSCRTRMKWKSITSRCNKVKGFESLEAFVEL